MVKKVDVTNLTQLPGVGDGTAEKLKEGGIITIMGIATSSPGQIKDASGLGEATSRKIINAARDLCDLEFELASEVEKKEKDLQYISTHCESVDKLLGGGLQLNSTLEAYGQFASGKTQLGHLLAVATIKKFPKGVVIYIDTENTFKTSRIRDFCKGLDVDPEEALSRIKVGKAISSDHQILLTENIEKEMVANKEDVKLIIIDSLMNHFRAEYLGRGSLANRQQMINSYLHKIAILVANYKMAVYLTNQVQSDPGAMFGDPTKHIGGNIVGHFATTRVYMRKGIKGSRKIILIDSPNLPEGDTNFMITDAGFKDV